MKSQVSGFVTSAAVVLSIATGLWGCATQKRADLAAQLASLDEQAWQTYHRALTDLEDGKNLAAVAALESLTLSNPDVAEIWLNLALAHYHHNDLERAGQISDAILERWPETVPAHNLAGMIAMQAGEFDVAEARFENALLLNPGYVNALYNMALLKDVYLRDVPQAIHYYQRYLEYAGDDEETGHWLEELRLSDSEEDPL